MSFVSLNRRVSRRWLALGAVAMCCLSAGPVAADQDPAPVPVAATSPLPLEALSSAEALEESAAEIQAQNESTAPAVEFVPFQFPLECHLWAKFLPGAWRKSVITTELFDPTGEPGGQTVTTEKQELLSIAEDSYILQISSTVNFAGQEIAAEPTNRTLRLATDRGGQLFKSEIVDSEVLELGELAIAVEICDIVHNSESLNLRDRIAFSAEVFPFVLRREVFDHIDDAPLQPVPAETTSVVSREVPFVFQDRTIGCILMRTERQHEKGTNAVLRLLHPDFPGGEVIAWSTDFDEQGRRVRWSIRRTTEFGVKTQSEPLEEQLKPSSAEPATIDQPLEEIASDEPDAARAE